MRHSKNFFLIIILLIIFVSSSVVLITQHYQKANANIASDNIRYVTDFWNRKVAFKDGPTSIISFSPSVTELIYELGDGEKIVGVSKETDYPSNIDKIDKVGYYSDIDFNKVFALKPDIIFASKYTYKEICEAFEEKNIPVVYIEPTNYKNMFDTIEILGEIFNEDKKAHKLENEIKSNIKLFTQNRDNNYKPNILFVQSIDPLYVVGKDTLIDDIINLCGGINVASNVKGFTEIDNNLIINKKIDIIIFSSKLKDKISIKYLKESNIFKETDAVKNDNIFFVTNDELYINPSMRILKPVNEISSQIKIYSEKEIMGNSNEQKNTESTGI